MSLTRFGEIGTRDLKARLGNPEKLPTVDQVRNELLSKTTAVTARRNGEMVRRHREELRPLAAEHRKMKEAHREQRQTLAGNQTKRAGQEERARAARLRKGVMGLWDRLSGVTTRKCSECTTSGTLSELRPLVEIAAAAAL